MATLESDRASPVARGRKRRDAQGKNDGKKFVCQNDGCGRTFTRAEHLQRHLLNHSNGEHTCDRCRAHFKRRDLLGKATVSSLHMRKYSVASLSLVTLHVFLVSMRGQTNGGLPCYSSRSFMADKTIVTQAKMQRAELRNHS